jgi:hypothetical protein
MDLNVYYCTDGRLLLVPDCFAPSLRAQHRYGFLRPIGAVAVDDSPRWKSVFDEIDERSYALVEDARMIDDLLASTGFRRTTDVVGTAPALASASS